MNAPKSWVSWSRPAFPRSQTVSGAERVHQPCPLSMWLSCCRRQWAAGALLSARVVPHLPLVTCCPPAPSPTLSRLELQVPRFLALKTKQAWGRRGGDHVVRRSRNKQTLRSSRSAPDLWFPEALDPTALPLTLSFSRSSQVNESINSFVALVSLAWLPETCHRESLMNTLSLLLT